MAHTMHLILVTSLDCSFCLFVKWMMQMLQVFMYLILSVVLVTSRVLIYTLCKY
jgi:hypothetical protein